MGIEPTAGGCPATGFEDQERHQAANYSHVFLKPFLLGSTAYCINRPAKKQGCNIRWGRLYFKMN